MKRIKEKIGNALILLYASAIIGIWAFSLAAGIRRSIQTGKLESITLRPIELEIRQESPEEQRTSVKETRRHYNQIRDETYEITSSSYFCGSYKSHEKIGTISNIPFFIDNNSPFIDNNPFFLEN